jgi:general secretion pathway protein C
MTALSRGALVWAAAGLALLSIALAARPLPGRFAGDSGLPAPGPAPAGDTAEAEVSVEAILAFAPFGEHARPVDEAPAEETALGLTLLGVVVATRPEGSGAIVAGGPGPVRTYAVGQEVAPGATLAEVHGDHVVLVVGDRRETLSFPERRDAAPVPAAPQESGVDALRALVTGSGDEPADAGQEAGAVGLRERVRDDPQAVLDDMGLAATAEGYRVAEGASETLLRVGLLPGDLVAKVNGQQVGNIEQDRGLFDDVAASGRARVEVIRDGQRVVLTFPLQ